MVVLGLNPSHSRTDLFMLCMLNICNGRLNVYIYPTNKKRPLEYFPLNLQGNALSCIMLICI